MADRVELHTADKPFVDKHELLKTVAARSAGVNGQVNMTMGRMSKLRVGGFAIMTRSPN